MSPFERWVVEAAVVGAFWAALFTPFVGPQTAGAVFIAAAASFGVLRGIRRGR